MLAVFQDHPVYIHEDSFQNLWFKAGDVAGILGFTNASDAVANNCPGAAKEIDYQSGRGRAALFVSEPGLYLLIMASKKTLAAKFKHWLAYEVLPQIRKQGTFGGTPNSESEAAEFWRLVDGAIQRNLDPEKAIAMYSQFSVRPSEAAKLKSKSKSKSKAKTNRSPQELPTPESIAQMLIPQWAEERCQFAHPGKLKVAIAFDDYQKFCQTHQRHGIGLRHFSAAIVQWATSQGKRVEKRRSSKGCFLAGVQLS